MSVGCLFQMMCTAPAHLLQAYPPYSYDCPIDSGGPVSYGNLVVWIEDNSANNQLILTLRGARRLTQHTFLPLARR